MKTRSLRATRSSSQKEGQKVNQGGFEEEAEDDDVETKEEESNEDTESTSSEEVEPPPLMVLNRTKRANAGNLMQKLLTEKEIEKKEGDEVYENLWGGFLDVENDHNFELTAADNQSADDDSNSELDEQDSDEEGSDEEGEEEKIGEGEEPKRKRRKFKKQSWLLSKMSETTVNENVLTPREQQARMAQCKKIAEKNRLSLEVLRQKQVEDQKKHAIRSRPRHLIGPKEAWYSDRHITCLTVPELKVWVASKPPKRIL